MTEHPPPNGTEHSWQMKVIEMQIFLYLSHYPSTWFDMCSSKMSAVRDFYKNLDWHVQFKSSVVKF